MSIWKFGVVPAVSPLLVFSKDLIQETAGLGRRESGAQCGHDIFAVPYKTANWRYQLRSWIFGSGIWGRGSTWRYTFVSLMYLRTEDQLRSPKIQVGKVLAVSPKSFFL